MLDLLAKIVNEGEIFDFRYERIGEGQVRLLVQPYLSDDLDTVTDDDARKARAALSRPLVFSGSHADVVARFQQYVASNADARANLKDAYDALTEKTKEAAKRAAQAAAGKGSEDTKAKGAEGGKPDDKSRDAADAKPTTADDGKQPTSVFD